VILSKMAMLNGWLRRGVFGRGAGYFVSRFLFLLLLLIFFLLPPDTTVNRWALDERKTYWFWKRLQHQI